MISIEISNSAPRPGTKRSKLQRTDDTIHRYRSLYARLIQIVAAEVGSRPNLEAMVAWYSRCNGFWSASTIRTYAAALLQWIDDLHQSNVLTSNDAEFWQNQLNVRRPIARVGPARCAARKRKSCSPDEIKMLRSFLLRRAHPDDLLLARLLTHGCMLGLRPSEWARATLNGSILTIVNSKCTNSRACGTHRKIILGDHYDAPATRASLRSLCSEMHTRIGGNGSTAVHRRRVISGLAARLRRACVKMLIRPLALYSLRHVALATAKKMLTACEVAALAGHATDRTAGQHYARRRSGWSLPTSPARPTSETISRVRLSGKAEVSFSHGAAISTELIRREGGGLSAQMKHSV